VLKNFQVYKSCFFPHNQETIALCLRKYFFLVRAQLLALIVAKTVIFDVKEFLQHQQLSGMFLTPYGYNMSPSMPRR
jgi:hypothetical protein